MHDIRREVLAVHVVQNHSKVPEVAACSSVVRTVAGPIEMIVLHVSLDKSTRKKIFYTKLLACCSFF